MKRLLSALAASTLVVVLAAFAAAQEKDKAAPEKDKAAPAKDKAAPEKDKAIPDKDKAAPPKDKDKAAPPDKPAETIKDSPFYPLAVGNAWNYKVGEQRFILKVAKHEKVGDVLCARVEMTVDGKVTSHEHIAVTGDGVVRIAFDDKRAEPPVLFLKLPFAKDATWKINSTVGKTDKEKGETVSGTFKEGEDKKVTVPAGAYEAVTSSTDDLDANGMKLAFTYYFVKDVGMVKQVIDVAGQKVVIELEKFEAAKK